MLNILRISGMNQNTFKKLSLFDLTFPPRERLDILIRGASHRPGY